jgi:hypothetical protein
MTEILLSKRDIPSETNAKIKKRTETTSKRKIILQCLVPFKGERGLRSSLMSNI